MQLCISAGGRWCVSGSLFWTLDSPATLRLEITVFDGIVIQNKRKEATKAEKCDVLYNNDKTKLFILYNSCKTKISKFDFNPDDTSEFG